MQARLLAYRSMPSAIAAVIAVGAVVTTIQIEHGGGGPASPPAAGGRPPASGRNAPARAHLTPVVHTSATPGAAEQPGGPVLAANVGTGSSSAPGARQSSQAASQPPAHGTHTPPQSPPATPPSSPPVAPSSPPPAHTVPPPTTPAPAPSPAATPGCIIRVNALGIRVCVPASIGGS